jgi:hypothetical protein
VREGRERERERERGGVTERGRERKTEGMARETQIFGRLEVPCAHTLIVY